LYCIRSKAHQQRLVLCNCKKEPHGELSIMERTLILNPYQTREYGCAFHDAKQDLERKKESF
jgi:hypothetical protein